MSGSMENQSTTGAALISWSRIESKHLDSPALFLYKSGQPPLKIQSRIISLKHIKQRLFFLLTPGHHEGQNSHQDEVWGIALLPGDLSEWNQVRSWFSTRGLLCYLSRQGKKELWRRSLKCEERWLITGTTAKNSYDINQLTFSVFS